MVTLETAPSSAYRPDVDGLRGIAVLAVIAFHAGVIARGGFVGVDIFFVISGYLISRLVFSGLREGSFSLATFYARRIRRIFPALAVVLVAIFAAGWFVLLADEYRQLGKHMLAAAAFASNFVLWRESGYFNVAAESKPLLHLWSLAIEEQFYLVFPPLLVLAWRRQGHILRGITVASMVSFLLCIAVTRIDAATAFYLPLTRFWELLAGSILAHVELFTPERLQHLRTRLTPNRQAAAGLLLVGVSIILLNGRSGFPGLWALLPVVGTCLVIAAGPAAWVNRRILAHPWLVLIGCISYPLYLWHWPLLWFTRLEGSPSPSLVAAAVAASFPLAWITYKGVERPVRFGSLSRNRMTVPVLAASLVLAGVAGAMAVVQNGMTFRFPPPIQGLVDLRYDYAAAYRNATCFLNLTQNDQDFAPECVDPPASGEPLVLLWGDSHAAQFYAGLRGLQRDSRFRVAQFTASGCPPILGIERESRAGCSQLNESILERVRALRPDVVLLAAAWGEYQFGALPQTLVALKAIGTRVVVFGPAPRWIDPLPRTLYLAYERDRLHRVPTRLASGFAGIIQTRDQQLHTMAASLDISYVSVLSVLCNEEGCLTRLGERAEDVVQWDQGHLTTVGSVYVMRNALATLFPSGLPCTTGC